jgi:tripartite-type tricarboxylate transporter receptor subunit TctC
MLRGLLLMACLCAPAVAQEFPSRTLRVIVPQPPGGGFDLVARVLAEGLAAELRQPVIVENRPGGGTVTGTDAVAKADADGYTILLGASANLVLSAGLYRSLPYDPKADFRALGIAAGFTYTMIARNDLPQASLKEVVDFARTNPGKLTYASAGNGSGQHIAAALLWHLAGVSITHVPYKGAQAAYQDLLPGRVDLFFDTSSTARPHVESGRVRAIAVSPATRIPYHPAVPTVRETWRGRFRLGDLGGLLRAQRDAATGARAAARGFRQGHGVGGDAGGPGEARRAAAATFRPGSRRAPRERPGQMDATDSQRRHKRRLSEHRTAASRAGLRYVSDGANGITRRRVGSGWTYFLPNGARIRDAAIRKRLNTLAIPPAWTDVWICPDPDGHIQATARDARGRKQYRYHLQYREARDRSEVRAHARLQRGAAAAARAHRARPEGAGPQSPPAPCHRGAASRPHADPRRQRRVREGEPLLRPDDATAAARQRRWHDAALRLSRQERRRAHYLAAGSAPGAHRAALPRPAGRGDVPVPDRQAQAAVGFLGRRQRLPARADGSDITAKDFRTWGGTMLAAVELRRLGAAASRREADRNIVAAVDASPSGSANTRAVCRKYYVHPALLEAYLMGKDRAAAATAA